MMYGGYGYNNMMGGGWVGWLLMAFFGAMVLIGVVLLVVWIARSMPGHEGPHGQMQHPMQHPMSGAAPGHDEAVATARRRLASGEITKEEFDAIMQALGS